MPAMPSLAGPWTTALHNGVAAELSTFWKRRMTMLSRISRSRPALTRRAAMLLLVVGIAACALPTLELRKAAAEPADGKAADKKLTGRIIVGAALYEDNRLQHDVIAIDAKTGKWERICGGARSARVRVSPDKGTLTFANDGIWTSALRKDSSPGRISDRLGWVAGWSADSRQVLVVEPLTEEVGGDFETWRMSVDGSDVTKLSLSKTEELYDWSPDGKWVVTASQRDTANGALYVMKLDGTEERRITTGGGRNYWARFSPDSRRLVYVHEEKGIHSLWVVETDGTGAKKVLQEQGLAGIVAACWSPDGKHLAVSRFDYILYEGEKAIPVPSAEHPYRIEIMDADGKNGKEVEIEGLIPLYIGPPEWR